MAYNTKAIKQDVNGKPIPQVFNPALDEYEVLKGDAGAARHVMYGPDGQPISVVDKKLAVRASEIEALLTDIKGKDYATQTTLASILTKLIAAPATEAKQDTLTGLVGALTAAAVTDPTASATLIALLKGLLKQLQGTGTGAAPVQLSGSNIIQDENGNDVLRVTEKPNLVPLPNMYRKVVDKEKYQIWKWDGSDKQIVAAHRDIAVAINNAKTELYISTNGLNGDYNTTVVFNSTNFPNLITGSTIAHVFLLPWTRNMTSSQSGKDWRMVVVSNTAQIYHNFPSRGTSSDGTAQTGDFAKFDESVIWDMPERKFPSVDPSASGVERYFPGLPTVAYEYYPILNTDVGFVDTYGNGGFGKSKTVGDNTYPRFYIPKRNNSCNPFLVMGGFEPGDKLTLLGTCVSNNSSGYGARICVFATDDGGRQWYNKYEFGAKGYTVTNWGNDINTSGLASAYTANSFKVVRRSNVPPSAAAKEPATLFSFNPAYTSIIADITMASCAVVTTAKNHDLSSGNIVLIQDNSESADVSPDWDWMRNDTASETSGGNGMLFMVEKVDATSFKLHEYVHNPNSNLPVRHIHHINRIKDGWIVGTGETYPEGWILYTRIRNNDSFGLLKATDNLTFYRLNSTDTGAQRTLGCILLDDVDNTVVFAMDSTTVARGNLVLPTGRTDEVSRNSSGIFKSKLSEIDDLTKSMPIFEAQEPAYFFKEKLGSWIFSGQRGEFAISFDKGLTWEVDNLGDNMQHFYGLSGNCIIADQFVIVLN